MYVADASKLQTSQPQEHQRISISLPHFFFTNFVIPNEFIASLKSRAFACWKTIQTVAPPPAPINTTQLQMEIQCNLLKKNKSKFEELQVFGWEKLHTGKWNDIELLFRDLYAFASLALAGIAFLDTQSLNAIRILDLAIMMGGPVFQPSLQMFVQFIHANYVRELRALAIANGSSTYNRRRFPILQFVEMENANLTPCLMQKHLSSNEQNTNANTNTNTNTNTNMNMSAKTQYIRRCVVDIASAFSTEADERCRLLKSVDAYDMNLVDFITDYYNEQQPVLIAGFANDWPAITLWTDLQYFMDNAGFRTIPVEIGRLYSDQNWTQELMPFHQFLSDYVLLHSSSDENGNDNGNGYASDATSVDNGNHDTNTNTNTDDDNNAPEQEQKQEQKRKQQITKCGYLAQHQLFEQIKCFENDFFIPEFVHIGETDFMTDGSINIWFGPKSTLTPIHFDPNHNILVQVCGYKYVRCFAPNEMENLYPFPNESLLHNSSTIELDLERVSDAEIIEQYPKFANVKQSYEVILRAGDALYIPPKWWHFVKSLSISISISFWFQ